MIKISFCMIDVLKNLNFLNVVNNVMVFFALCPNLNADTLDEVLRLTFSTNKQLLLSRRQLQSLKLRLIFRSLH